MTTPGSRWLYWHVSPWWGSDDWWPMEIGQDTVLGGSTYKIVVGGPGALKDDGGKVWFYPFEPFLPYTPDSLPLLLYDFELQVGDSFQAPVDTAQWLTVIEKDSVQMLDGSYRDRIRFEQGYSSDWSCSSDSWIEGMGDPWFLFLMVSDCFELGMNLECYWIESEALLGPCSYLGQPEVDVEDAYVLSPSGSHGRFKLTGPVEKIQSLTVHDAIGQEVDEGPMRAGEIDLSQTGPGIYFVRIRSSAGSQTIRFCLEQR
jgi:hypothetical protein